MNTRETSQGIKFELGRQHIKVPLLSLEHRPTEDVLLSFFRRFWNLNDNVPLETWEPYNIDEFSDTYFVPASTPKERLFVVESTFEPFFTRRGTFRQRDGTFSGPAALMRETHAIKLAPKRSGHPEPYVALSYVQRRESSFFDRQKTELPKISFENNPVRRANFWHNQTIPRTAEEQAAAAERYNSALLTVVNTVFALMSPQTDIFKKARL